MVTYNTPFMQKPDAGFRLGDIRAIWDAIVSSNAVSTAYGISAAGTNQAGATALTSVFNQIDTVGASSGVSLPYTKGNRNSPYNYVILYNNGASTLTVYASVPPAGQTADTINGVAGATGITVPVGTLATFVSMKPGSWLSDAGTGGAFGAITVTTINGLTLTTSTGTVTIPNGVTVTGPATSGTLALINPPIQAGGSTLAVTAAMSGKTILLDTAAGTTATLPAATGSGNKYKFIVSTTCTSNAHKILAASVSDFMNGIVSGYTGTTPRMFSSAAATNHSIQMPFAGTQPSGGFIGDYFNVVDIAANLWSIDGMYQAGVTPTTPFSAATT